MPRIIPWLISLGALICAIVASSYGKTGLDFKEKIMEAAADSVTALVVAALFLERSLSVINNLLFGTETIHLERGAGMGNRGALEALSVIDDKKEKLRLSLGFLAAVLISAAGVRALQNLFKTPPTDHLFITCDIVLTAGLLAGGSNGLGQLLAILKEKASATLRDLRASRIPSSQAYAARATSDSAPYGHVAEACRSLWAMNKEDCGAFVRAVAAHFRKPLAGDASAIVATIGAAPWRQLRDGRAAADAAAAGELVIAGLTAAELGDNHGHVVVVVPSDGPLAHLRYPYAYWGSLNPAVREKGGEGTTLNWCFPTAHRDRVHYAAIAV